ncbi:MAG: hypothetical protein ACYCW6_04675 [Candidatus Xenobia bacterium]
MMQGELLLDNPLLIKHVRSRLRQRELLPGLGMVILSSLFAVWLAAELNARANPSDGMATYGLILGLQGLLLFFLGTTQVATSMLTTRASGMLEFHRISPVTALSLALGFLLGAPIREYLFFAVTLPFSLAVCVLSGFSPIMWLVCSVAMGLSSLLYHAMALAIASVAPPGGRQQNAAAAAVVAFVYATSTIVPMRYFTIVPAWQLGVAITQHLPLPLQDVSLMLMHHLLFGVFLLIGCTRRIHSDASPLLSKPLAVLLYFLACRLVVQDLKAVQDISTLAPLVGLYAMLGLGLVLVPVITSAARDLARGVRRSVKLDKPMLPWSDAAPNPVALVGLLAVLAMTRYDSQQSGHYVEAMAVAAAVLAYVAGALQALLLRRGKMGFMALILFVLWLAPVLTGVILSLGRMPEMSNFVSSLCPFIGIGMVFNGASYTVWVLLLNVALALVAQYASITSAVAVRAQVRS